ncbi:type IV pilus biogenesis/stability protein PilW [Bernardetia sp. OM2101]|uniref:tetratricopeptide repeat protein n=1 Tax=Bernardetia sp. OM2101 TaxID=3344876 RepID=UPI0035CEBAFF
MASASLWDDETSQLNAVPYQTVMQVLVGNHLKHSQNYHFWRISMYEEAWNKNPDSLLLYDAMAVSYHLTGRTNDAIRLMIAKEQKKAGEYSTYSNLATFYIADRELYKARFYAQKLLKKFSPLSLRDKYQVYWIDYLIECAARKGATKKLRRKITLPVQGDFTVDDLADSRQMYEIPNFYSFLARKFRSKKDRNKKNILLTEKQTDEAIFAMLQLLRFSHSENIILIEAIGDLLLGKTVLPALEEGQVTYKKEQLENQKAAAQVAAFAYLRSAQLISKYSPKAEKSYTFLASSALLHHQNYLKKEERYNTEDILVFLAQKIKERDNYLNPIFKQEKKWIEEGLRLDKEFESNYLPELENYSDSTFFIKTDTVASQLLYILNDKIPDYLVVDSLQKTAYLAAFIAEEKAQKNKDEKIIVSRIDTQTSIKVALTALISLSLAIILFVRFRKE